jgi:hypothetical protein
MRILLAFLLMTGVAFAAEPLYLVCDVPPADQRITQYDIFQDDVFFTNTLAESDGSLKWELVGVTPGKYTWTVKAINVWGPSDPSDPYISPALAGKPLGVKLIK